VTFLPRDSPIAPSPFTARVRDAKFFNIQLAASFYFLRRTRHHCEIPTTWKNLPVKTTFSVFDRRKLLIIRTERLTYSSCHCHWQLSLTVTVADDDDFTDSLSTESSPERRSQKQQTSLPDSEKATSAALHCNNTHCRQTQQSQQLLRLWYIYICQAAM